MISLEDVLFALTGQNFPQCDHPIQNTVIDSRLASPGSLFIALPGEHVDGHAYVQSAFEKGAKIALIGQDLPGSFETIDLRPDNFQLHHLHEVTFPVCLRVEDPLTALHKIATYWRKEHPVRTVGITGSVGKTSTKELTAALLSQKFAVLKNPGNRNNEIGLPLTLMELDNHHKRAVLEMGFYVPGEIQLLCDIAHPHIGVITNIGTVHAERAGSQEIIAHGKAELVRALPPAPEGIAILNMDDPWVRKMKSQTQARVITYGINHSADVTAKDIQILGLEGISCVVSAFGEDHFVRSPLLGKFSVYTILCAVTVALQEGLNWPEITAGLEKSRLDLRMHPIKLSNEITLLDDSYNASPTSTIAALEFLHELSGRRVAILGDMLELGQYEYSDHHAVGLVAADTVDFLILIGERTKIIAAAALENGFPENNLRLFSNSQSAAEEITALTQKGDIVLVKGSNIMRMDRIIAALTGDNDGK